MFLNKPLSSAPGNMNSLVLPSNPRIPPPDPILPAVGIGEARPAKANGLCLPLATSYTVNALSAIAAIGCQGPGIN